MSSADKTERKYHCYSAMKNSDVSWLGEIPEHWVIVPAISHMKESKRSRDNSAYKVLSLSYGKIVERDVSDNFGLLPASFDSYQRIRPNDIVLRLTDLQNDKKSLRVGLARDDGIITSAYVALEVQQGMLPAYGYYLLHCYDINKVFYSLGEGVRQSMNYTHIKKMPLLVPPLDEQRAIVRFLDRETARIDALIEKKRRQIELLNEKRAAIITHAVTKGLDPSAPMKDSGVEWLGEVPSHWHLPPLYARFSVELGKMLDEKRITGKCLLPYVRNVDVQWDTVNIKDLPEMDIMPNEYPRYTLKAGDLLVCEGGEVGRTAVWCGQLAVCAFQKAIHRLRPITDQDLPRFLYYVMYAAALTGVFIAQGNPNTIPHLTAEKLRVYRFPFPPTEEQRAIVEFLDRETGKIDVLVEKINISIDRLREYRTAFISAAVTGKIDICEEVA